MTHDDHTVPTLIMMPHIKGIDAAATLNRALASPSVNACGSLAIAIDDVVVRQRDPLVAVELPHLRRLHFLSGSYRSDNPTQMWDKFFKLSHPLDCLTLSVLGVNQPRWSLPRALRVKHVVLGGVDSRFICSQLRWYHTLRFPRGPGVVLRNAGPLTPVPGDMRSARSALATPPDAVTLVTLAGRGYDAECDIESRALLADIFNVPLAAVASTQHTRPRKLQLHAVPMCPMLPEDEDAFDALDALASTTPHSPPHSEPHAVGGYHPPQPPSPWSIAA